MQVAGYGLNRLWQAPNGKYLVLHELFLYSVLTARSAVVNKGSTLIDEDNKVAGNRSTLGGADRQLRHLRSSSAYRASLLCMCDESWRSVVLLKARVQ